MKKSALSFFSLAFLLTALVSSAALLTSCENGIEKKSSAKPVCPMASKGEKQPCKEKDQKLIKAAFKGSKADVEECLKCGANVNGKNAFGDTPLIMAVLQAPIDVNGLLV